LGSFWAQFEDYRDNFRGGNHQLKRAFTLIELLVVIAIIAILAAILFPVFAQAKLQAKKISSLANVKEVGLAELMYQNDADDNFVLSQNTCDPAVSGALCIAGNVPTNNENVGVGVADTWVYLTQPYIKNFGILVDPGIGDSGGYLLGANSTRTNQDNVPQFGYNYMFLSPFYDCNSSLSRNASVAVHPSSTVMFTTSADFTPTIAHGFYDSNAPGAWPLIAPAPHACIYYGFYPAGTAAQWTGNWSVINPTGKHYTSSVRAVLPYNGGNVVWVDGHAKFGSDGYLASGTDYGTSSSSSASLGATILNQANPTNYLWTLDGTLNDLQL